MKPRFTFGALLWLPLTPALTVLPSCSQPPTGPQDPWPSGEGAQDGGPPAGWTLTWSDEFEGPQGSAVDTTKWNFETGGGGWGNQELEYDTSGTENAVVGGGLLTVTASAIEDGQTLSCWYGVCRYTSARMDTQGKFSQQYGRVEARIQIPTGQGLWPAFWMLGADINQVSWPACGEIDIMENAGAAPNVALGSLHFTGNNESASFSSPTSLAEGFHVYALDWTSEAIWFYVDDTLYETQQAADFPAAEWPYNQPFFIILNLAVGGSFGGAPDAMTSFPQQMRVDYVRVYSQSR